jgi:hypothetical protein
VPQKAVYRVGQVARHPLSPLTIGVHACPRDLPGARLQRDDEEDQVANRSSESQSLDRKEVAPMERVPVRLDEPLPGSLLLPLRRWRDAGRSQDLRHRGTPDLDR